MWFWEFLGPTPPDFPDSEVVFLDALEEVDPPLLQLGVFVDLAQLLEFLVGLVKDGLGGHELALLDLPLGELDGLLLRFEGGLKSATLQTCLLHTI